MKVFGITGGTGAGKSSVSDELKRQGVNVIDADKAARSVCEKGKPCLAELAAEFGDDIIDENGELKRHELGNIVFSDKKKLERLNAITHKYIDEEIGRELKCAKDELTAIDGAVIIGSPVEKRCMFIVSVIADMKVRQRRIMARDALSEAEAAKRIASQPRDDYYISHSAYVIYNNGSQMELSAKVTALIKRIKEFGFEQII